MVSLFRSGAATLVAVSLTAGMAKSQGFSDYAKEIITYSNFSDSLRPIIYSSALSLSEKKELFGVLKEGGVILSPLKIGSMIEKITSKDQQRVNEGFKDAAIYFGEPVLKEAASYLGASSLYAGPIAAGTVAAIEIGYAAYEAKLSFYEAKIQKNSYISGVADLIDHLLPGGRSLSPNKISSDKNIITQLLSENKSLFHSARTKEDINRIYHKLNNIYVTRLNNALSSLIVDRANITKEERISVFGYKGFDESDEEKNNRITYLDSQIERLRSQIESQKNNKENILTKYIYSYLQYIINVEIYNLSGAFVELEKTRQGGVIAYLRPKNVKEELIKSTYLESTRIIFPSIENSTTVVSPTPITPITPTTPVVPSSASVIANYGGWARDVPTGWTTAFSREQLMMDTVSSGTYSVPGVTNLAIARTYPDMIITTTTATRGTYRYTDWGEWNNQQVTGQAYPSYGGNWVVGHSAVQFSQLPTSGSATYTGVAAGNNYGAPVAGVVDIQAQFATRTMNSRITFGSTSMNWTGIPMVSGTNGVASFNSTNATGGRFGGNFFGLNGVVPAEAAGYFRSGDFGVTGVWRAKQSPSTIFIGEN